MAILNCSPRIVFTCSSSFFPIFHSFSINGRKDRDQIVLKEVYLKISKYTRDDLCGFYLSFAQVLITSSLPGLPDRLSALLISGAVHGTTSERRPRSSRERSPSFPSSLACLHLVAYPVGRPKLANKITTIVTTGANRPLSIVGAKSWKRLTPTDANSEAREHSWSH